VESYLLIKLSSPTSSFVPSLIATAKSAYITNLSNLCCHTIVQLLTALGEDHGKGDSKNSRGVFVFAWIGPLLKEYLF